jgi:hypothetical protein
VLIYPVNANERSGWDFIHTDNGFSVEVPPGWVSVPYTNSYNGVGFAEYGKDDIVLSIGYLVNPDGVISNEDELEVLINKYATLIGTTITSKLTYQDNSIMALGITKTGELSQFQVISRSDNLILVNAIYKSNGAALHYAEIVGNIVNSIIFD